MPDKKSFPWLLLAGFGALVYFLMKDKGTSEAPTGYPYPVGTTLPATISPATGTVMTTQNVPTSPVWRPSQENAPYGHPNPNRETPTGTSHPPTDYGRDTPGGMPPHQTPRFTDLQYPIEAPTISNQRVLGHPTEALKPVYDTNGTLIGFNVSK